MKVILQFKDGSRHERELYFRTDDTGTEFPPLEILSNKQVGEGTVAMRMDPYKGEAVPVYHEVEGEE